MARYTDIFLASFPKYWDYLRSQILCSPPAIPWFENYFYLLIFTSLLAWALEIIFPWRKGQPIFRKDFWLDGFYMFFNFFIFSLIGFHALSNVAGAVFMDFLALFGKTNIAAVEIKSWPVWGQLLTLFVLTDFVHWNVHRLLHRIPWLWQFHKVHHSVKEMGFAAHLRFHWMETIIYKSVQFIPLSLVGFGISDFFAVHAIALLIGHINHSNLGWTYGPARWVLNNPAMHIWHHAKVWPADRPQGMNFGLSLSVWDYLFKTAHIPGDGRDVELGFPEDEKFPRSFPGQMVYPLIR